MNHVLMADVIGSRNRPSRQLQAALGDLVQSCTARHKDQLLSPLTITLGDEFQGIADSLQTVLSIIQFMELERFRRELDFQLRYSYVAGEVETPINSTVAHGMLGPALTAARARLVSKGRDRDRFMFQAESENESAILNHVFLAIDGISQRWNVDEGAVIYALLTDSDDTNVGRTINRHRSAVWRRRKSLLIEEYLALWAAVDVVAQGSS